MRPLLWIQVTLVVLPFGYAACGGSGASTGAASSSGGSSSSSAVGSTSTAGSSGTVASSSSSSGSVENCFDGIDNDLNGKTDCDDPACQGLGYLEVPPGLAYGTLDAASCASGKVTSVDECGACSGCTAKAGTCEPSIDIWKGQGCQGAPNVTGSMDGGCYSPGIAASNNQGLSYTVSGIDEFPATCTKGSSTPKKRSFCEVEVPHYENGNQLKVACVKPTGCVLVGAGESCPAGFEVKPIAISKGACVCDCTAMQTCTTSGLSAQLYSSFSCDTGQPHVDLVVDGNCHDAMSIIIESVALSAGKPATNATCTDVLMPQTDGTVCCAS